MPYHIDWETYSQCPLKAVGAYCYAEHPTTEIILAAIAKYDQEPVLWDFSTPGRNDEALDLLAEASISGDPIYAHNAPFEIAISRALWLKTFGFDPPELEQWRCTMAMARRAAMPAALGELAKALKLPELKSEDGKKLIKVFCEPQSAGKRKGTRILPDMDEKVTVMGERLMIQEAWQRFRNYNLQDVRTERRVCEWLKPFELRGETLKAFQFDLRMNHRGIPVNIPALKQARRIIDDTNDKGEKEFLALTGLKPSQTAKVLAWLKDEGYPGGDLQAGTMEEILEGTHSMTEEGVRALQIRSQLAFAAVKKVPAMLDAVCTDGRIRGCLTWSGAIRTHRWSGRIIQPQNFKRPQKGSELFYEALRDGADMEGLSLLWNPFDGIASSIRHFIQPPDCEILDSDYANIEARILPWIARQEDMLEQFRQLDRLKAAGAPKSDIALVEPYVVMATKIFDKPGAAITGDERWVGKQAVLGAGFQCGAEKFQVMCANNGRTLDDDLCKQTIDAYRDANPQIVSVWRQFQTSAVDAIENLDSVFTVRGRIRLQMARKFKFPALLVKLPSGHCLVYPFPELRSIWMFKKQKYSTEEEAMRVYRWHKNRGELKEDDRVWKTKEITFFGPDALKETWGRQSTYGGKLTENVVQATAGDFITHGVLRAEAAGYPPFMLIHDQTLSEYRPEQGHTKEAFKAALCTLPAWADGFPLEASCGITPYYTKD